ncbi:hypothetical protein [Alteromonas pelagimontana]|nr:hypothetical protein [Alteromonas pelagimontana]
MIATFFRVDRYSTLSCAVNAHRIVIEERDETNLGSGVVSG